MMNMEKPLNIFTTSKNRKILPIEKISRLIPLFYSKERISKKKETNLIVCSDYMIKKLNRRFRKVNRSTDVLSFSFNDKDFLGEIYISLKRTEVQARRYGCSFSDEFLRLFIHGLLHLAGYDHKNRPERMIMEKKTNYYLELIGIKRG